MTSPQKRYASTLSAASWANSTRWRGILRAHHALFRLPEPEDWEMPFRTGRAGGLGRQKGRQRAPAPAARLPARVPPSAPTALGLLKAWGERARHFKKNPGDERSVTSFDLEYDTLRLEPALGVLS